ncbi:cytochrome c oxidase assembly factor 6 homolog [Diadema setosum]|uniref:cytochrome c oxidase assembly factor 6 homolog n=1 Tax=Diadema antillarum TaxID=105358 RepID=UPI003A838F34
MSKPSFPDANSRKRCWAARDSYFECLTAKNDDESKCQEFKEAFEANCSKAWAKYFLRRRRYLKYQDELAAGGFIPTENEDS